MISSAEKKKRNLKDKIFHELVEYWINVLYLALMFAAFTWYRRFLLAAHGITYTDYWVAVIEALILAKVIMIGDVFRLGRGLEQKPLVFPTLYKTIVFTLFVAVFTVTEHVIIALWKGEGLPDTFVDFFGKGYHEILAGCIIIFVAFIPFFAFKELGKVLGAGKIQALFFQKRAEQGFEESGPGSVCDERAPAKHHDK
jgi:hypothetical protein